MKKRTSLNLFNPIPSQNLNNTRKNNKSQNQSNSSDDLKLLTKLELDQTYKNTHTTYNKIKNMMYKDNVKNLLDDYKKPERNKSAVITRQEAPKNFKKLFSSSVVKTQKNLNNQNDLILEKNENLILDSTSRNKFL